MVSPDFPWPNVSVRDFKGWGVGLMGECVREINVLFLLKFYLNQFVYSYYNNVSIT